MRENRYQKVEKEEKIVNIEKKIIKKKEEFVKR